MPITTLAYNSINLKRIYQAVIEVRTNRVKMRFKNVPKLLIIKRIVCQFMKVSLIMRAVNMIKKLQLSICCWQDCM